jgi:uncharacterized protein YndB with AHSA1/START domain
MPTKPSLTIRRRLNAPPAKVYAAWTDPQKVKRWWGPREADETVHVEADVRVGGRFRFVMHGSGGERHDVGGVYREVVPDERLVFTWAWHTTPERESLVTVSFESDGDGTILRLTHEQFFDEAARDGHLEGWSGALDRLERDLTAAAAAPA